MSPPSDLPPHQPRKRFGQHFLHERGVLDRIVRALAPARDDRLVEIGPGEGALTRALLGTVDQLDVIELDRDLAATLHQRLGQPAGLTVHQGDALSFDFTGLAARSRLRLIGNLPYNISTPLLFHLFGHAAVIRDMHFMLQKEVVDRLVADPGSKTYGRLSVMAQFHCHMWRLFTVPPGAFRPPPKVDSAVIRLIPREPDAGREALAPLLHELVRRAFGQRRKTLRNSLAGLADGEVLARAGLHGGERPEVVDLDQWLTLAGCARDEH